MTELLGIKSLGGGTDCVREVHSWHSQSKSLAITFLVLGPRCSSGRISHGLGLRFGMGGEELGGEKKKKPFTITRATVFVEHLLGVRCGLCHL